MSSDRCLGRQHPLDLATRVHLHIGPPVRPAKQLFEACLNADLADMERQLTAQFAADHLDAAKVTFQRDGDLRYVGQGYELKIRLPTSAITPEGLTGVWKLFHEAHQREYGHFFADNPIEIVNVRVMGAGAMPSFGEINWAMLVHGEQSIEVFGEIPPEGTVESVTQIVGIYDKGSGALAVMETESKYVDTGKPAF